ncbi:hypothetical protein MNV49_002691 [Pseudohyphozyma bogoriensis]|nr:hypothetical protein MNV49_002691 [Pseudohyphozyma bogoriensis]
MTLQNPQLHPMMRQNLMMQLQQAQMMMAQMQGFAGNGAGRRMGGPLAGAYGGNFARGNGNVGAGAQGGRAGSQPIPTGPRGASPELARGVKRGGSEDVGGPQPEKKKVQEAEWADRVTNKVGPLFVAIALVLIGGCTFTFFDVVYPSRFLTPDTSWFSFVSGTAWSVYCVVMLSFHYYKAITVRPGSPLDKPSLATPRGFADLLPSALCIGPLSPKHQAYKHRLTTRTREKILEAQYAAAGGANAEGWSGATWKTLDFGVPWPHYTPKLFTLLLFVLASVMALAVGVMAIFQLWLVMAGETAVESHDNEWYRKTAKARGRIYENPYDLGRKENLARFFNVGEGRYHWSTIFLPLAVPPSSDGWNWPKRAGWERFAMDFQDELTDEEELSDGEEVAAP